MNWRSATEKLEAGMPPFLAPMLDMVISPASLLAMALFTAWFGSMPRAARRSGEMPAWLAMAAAVLEVAGQPEFAGVPVRVVPGLTAAQAVASRVGAPLGHDFCVLSLSDVLKPWDVVVDRLRHAAAADLVIALYNPRSKHRPHQLGEAQQALLEEIANGKVTPELEEKIKKVVEDHVSTFTSS